jgi:hypothetical protein
MSRFAVLLLGLMLPLFADGARPRPGPPESLPNGKFQVTFLNGVVEVCHFEKENVSESEPLRSSGGTVVVKNGASVVTFEDDRTERWTPVGKRWLVEHWCPSSSYPAGKPVLGIAEREE